MSWYAVGLTGGLVLFIVGAAVRSTRVIIAGVVVLVLTVFGLLLVDPERSDHQHALRDTHVSRDTLTHDARYATYTRVVVLQPCLRGCHD